MEWDTFKQQNNPYAVEDPNPTPKGCKKDKVLYQKAGIVTPPPTFLHDDTLNLKATMADKSFPKNIKADWLKKLDSTWMPNVTLIDTGHLEQFSRMGNSKHNIKVDLSTDIITQWSGYLWSEPKNPTCLYDYAADYFTKVAAALHHLRGRLRVEPILGEMCEVLEKIRLGFYTERTNKPALEQAKDDAGDPKITEDYPTEFNRIHLSNVPDYTGGTLSVLLFATPITPVTENFEARVAFTCLRNPPAFEDIEVFNNEYRLLPTQHMISQVFGCTRAKTQDELYQLPPGMLMPGLIGIGYIQWSRALPMVPFERILDRQTLTAWIHGLLLKTAIPEQRQVPAKTLINSPFNLTLLFRIFLHLKNVGYPAHWLSDILSSIIASPLDTRAFPQKSVPFKISEAKTLLDKSRPLKKFSTKPFIAELTTLTTMWLPTLGFGLLKGNDALPSPESLRNYSVTFRNVNFDMGFETAFVLVLIDMDIATPTGPYPIIPLRLLLQNKEDELRNALRSPRDVREKGLHVITTWKFETETKTGRFWMRENVMKSVMDRRNGWHACIWRVDRWDIVGQPVRAAGGSVQDLGVSWAD